MRLQDADQVNFRPKQKFPLDRYEIESKKGFRNYRKYFSP